jgi:UDP-N-acetylmuramate dehydrogenase
MEELYNKLLTKIPKDNIRLNEDMSKHTSIKIGGPADIFIKIKTIEELKYILEVAKEKNIPITVIGNGSNLLVKDKGIRGIVLQIKIDEISVNTTEIEVGAGTLLSKLSKTAYENSLAGLEFAAGIPGTIGGAITMNAGAYGGEFKDIVVSTTYIDKDLNIHTISNKEHNFEYRNSIFKDKNFIILKSKLKLKEDIKENIEAKMKQNSNKRKESQPIEYPSAGSVFKRGNGFITAEAIDKCGLKGYNIRDAYVSEKHAGFIVNKGKATAKDVIDLIEYIKQVVYEKYKIKIEMEIKIIGE